MAHAYSACSSKLGVSPILSSSSGMVLFGVVVVREKCSLRVIIASQDNLDSHEQGAEASCLIVLCLAVTKG